MGDRKHLRRSSRAFTFAMATLAALVATAPTAIAEALKTAIVMPGIKTDKSFNQAGYEGVKLAAESLGIDFAFSEKVPQPDQPEALSDYARRGYKVVIGLGGEFQEAVDRVARRFPDTKFIVVNGVKPGGNVATMSFDFPALGYVMGYIAGRADNGDKVAYIGAQKLKFYVELGEGFAKGFKAARPGGEVLTAWTNDWDDVAKGKEAALSLIGQGAEVVFPSMDNAVVGSYQGAKEKGKKAIGIYYDAIVDWPDVMIQSAVFDMRHALVKILTDAKNGTLTGKAYIYGLETPEATRIGSYGPSVSEQVKTEVNGVIEKIKSGEIKAK
ncbi:BMP family protein [Methylobacterium planeticum]|uniref:BMP family ABC transporter substrate-binding protein n=1 Tax=Methylobacterium planeticum TaxID=2615211 RepID=A0A6N6MI65_9HYPH|nr:BMP family protein [Methylobacterium planeticum]KAB1069211.1 BMP family ABC transporter substrate-binding protein [Methylobacterium planeticum]